jgi:hypothetical protein
MTREERERAIDQYGAGFDEVRRALEVFPPDRLTARPLPGKWTAAEIVHHLADSEMNGAIRLRKLLAEDRAQIWGYDQEEFAVRLRYQERELGPALDAFRAARAVTMQLLRGMTDADWAREGWHTESGRYTAERWLEIYSVHAHDHAAQIRRLREALAG